jgi:hypothetical protein
MDTTFGFLDLLRLRRKVSKRRQNMVSRHEWLRVAFKLT